MRVSALIIKLIIKGGVASPALQILMSSVFKDHSPVRIVKGDHDLRLNGILSAGLPQAYPKKAKAKQEEDDGGHVVRADDPSPADLFRSPSGAHDV
jgi:hypothetical protein